jgi:di/tricarboxylate transporter
VTFEIALVLLVLLGALVLFVTEWIAMDVVALLVLAVLGVSGVVTPDQALSGFSNPAVVTVWAMFILSAGLTRTGVADLIGRTVLRWVGTGEARMIVVIMLTAAVLSAFMNNIGVAALMLPVVLNVARCTGRAPSRLLMPLAYGCLLGGLTTLIGTPPNLLVSQSLAAEGFEPFGMFDFTPVGGPALLAGIAFVAWIGRRQLPRRDPAREASSGGATNLEDQYRLDARSAVLRLPDDSPLASRTLEECRLGSATGLNVYAIVRGSRTILAPGPDAVLRPADQLLVEGALDRFNEMRAWSQLIVEEEDPGLDAIASAEIGLAELHVEDDSELAGRTLREVDFRRRFGAIVVALARGAEGESQAERVTQRGLAITTLRPGDRLLVQGRRSNLDSLPGVAVSGQAAEAELHRRYGLRSRIFTVQVPAGSRLEGEGLAESRIGDAMGLAVLGLSRGDETRLLPEPEERLCGGDRLIVRGKRDDLELFVGLQGLEIEEEAAPRLQALEVGTVLLLEAMLSPRTSLAGTTVGDLHFRERYGLRVLALLREGTTIDTGLRDLPLRFGDALLLLGPEDKARMLAADPDFLVLSLPREETVEAARAPVAALIMVAVLASVLGGWLSIAVASVAGAALMVSTGCLSMGAAYRSIEWRSIFLIAGMLPLGIALGQTGAATLVAEALLGSVGFLGPWGILVTLYVLTAAATTIIPTAALVVLMSPIAFTACAQSGLPESAVLMAIAMAASASFTSPISHPANLLVMGPGGYRFVDYVKLGLPLALVVMLTVLLVLPWVYPLTR